ncbi:uncharacterized protein LOC124466278 [Hypomesus transpacificus]|uniref:uncharacterized protein LOC124466278 n=1 Tax=Hypomesus transpacificus TaxID=137520 RepID=UPI001F079EF5|nr:uncharacterized protein LOC124466278 [Hypomesus transpacificus]
MNNIQRVAFIALLYCRRRRRRLFWVHPIRRLRTNNGAYHRLVQELRLDNDMFQRYFRLNRAEFDDLLTRVRPRIARLNTSFIEAISPAERLAICLRYLAKGDSFMSISFSYRVGSCTVARIVGAVSKAIWDCLVEEFLPVPTKQDWRAIAEGFLQRWNFPNCLGSIDGKHVVIQAPHNSGSLYHNYKGTFSIVLLAVVDTDSMFRVIDVGGYGQNSDGGTLGNSAFSEALKYGDPLAPLLDISM